MPSKNGLTILAAVLCVAAALASPRHPAAAPLDVVQPHAPSPPTRRSFTETRSWSEYVTMRDGVWLAVDVHLQNGRATDERTATILPMSRYYESVDIRGAGKPFLR